jgi:cell pole-organizing protein PopZ
MSEQGTPSGTPSGGTPGGNASGNTGATNSAPASQRADPLPPQDNPRARGHSPAQDARAQAQTPPAEQKIRVGETEYDAQTVADAIAARAEAQSQRATLPASPADYRAELTPNFSPGEGVRFELDQKDPLLAQARELAFAKGLDQSTFSSLLDLYAASKVGEVQRNATMRDVNMKQLGAAAPTRIEAVATWLAARAGSDGKAVGDFLRQFPSSQIVKALERVMQYQSSGGGADFSQSHRAQQEDPGRIPGYSEMNFQQRRVAQMQLAMRNAPKRER